MPSGGSSLPLLGPVGNQARREGLCTTVLVEVARQATKLTLHTAVRVRGPAAQVVDPASSRIIGR